MVELSTTISPAGLAAKVLLLNELVRQNVRPAWLAHRLGTTPQEVNRLTDVRHTTPSDGIAAALHALACLREAEAASLRRRQGKRLDLRAL